MLLLDKTLLRLSKGLWPWIFLITAIKIGALIFTVNFAGILSSFLGSLTSPSMTLTDAMNASATALLTAFIILLFELAGGEAQFRCTAKARELLRRQIFTKVLELDVGNLDRIGAVSAITSSVDGVESMQSYYSQYLPGLLYSLFAPVYLFFRLKAVSLPASVILLVFTVTLFPVHNIFRTRIENVKTDFWNSMEDLTGCYLEGVRGLSTLKLFGRDRDRSALLGEKAEDFHRKTMAVMKVNFSSFLATYGMIYLAVFLCLVSVLAGISAGTVDLSGALLIFMLSISFFSSEKELLGATHSALSGVSAAEKVEKILQTDSSRPYHPELSAAVSEDRGIVLDHVSFSYSGRSAALKDVSLCIPEGKMTALIGLSGCGKSTIASLLMRFYDPGSGRILLNGRDITSMTPEELRRHIILVPQTVSLYSGTIAENLRMADHSASDAELMEALDSVRLGDFVRSLPAGLAESVGDAGAKLSGGQRQKIGIARALLSGAETIIFDESTSSVDTVSEQEIWNCINALGKSRTLIIISHRLSTIRHSDCIFVLENGRISQSGNDQSLMKENGLYRKIVLEQASLEDLGKEAIR